MSHIGCVVVSGFYWPRPTYIAAKEREAEHLHFNLEAELWACQTQMNLWEARKDLKKASLARDPTLNTAVWCKSDKGLGGGKVASSLTVVRTSLLCLHRQSRSSWCHADVLLFPPPPTPTYSCKTPALPGLARVGNRKCPLFKVIHPLSDVSFCKGACHFLPF